MTTPRVVRCRDCPGLCCKAFDALVFCPGDIPRLAKALKLTEKRFMQRYVTAESFFDLLCRTIDGSSTDGQRLFLELHRQPCPFLDQRTKRCTVYAARPKACRVFKPGNDYCRHLRREHGQHQQGQPLRPLHQRVQR